MKRIIWLSANKLGYELLKETVKFTDVYAIITLKEDANTVMYDSIPNKKWREFGIDVYETERINNEKELIKKLSPDIIVMCGWRQIIDKEILDLPKDCFVGFHPTLLPKGRGPAPLINSIIEGYNESGLTFFHVSQGLDDGDIIGQEKFFINDNDYASDAYEKVINAGKKLIRKYIPLLMEGTAPRVKQDNSKATIFEKRSLKDNEIDIENESADQIYRKIRALSKPYKGAYIKKGGKKIIIWMAEIQNDK